MKCIHCGKEIPYAYMVTEDDEPLCMDCYTNAYEQCEKCHRAIPKGTGMCQHCSDEIFRRTMNSYSTKLYNRFGNKSDSIKCLNDRYYGLEMEYNYFYPSQARVLFKNQYADKLIYNKSDSSISAGVEIVTIPLVKSRVLKLIDDMDISRIKPTYHGECVTSGAGLHIHVSRNTISPIAIHRLSLLFNSNWANAYKKYIYYLVGRKNDLRDTRVSDNYFAVGTTDIVGSATNVSGHCVAFNLGNRNTVEFRLFKATTNPTQLKSYVDFVDKAIEFAETKPIKLMTIPNFMTYLYLNTTNEWLHKRLEEIKLLNPELFIVKEKQFTADYYLSKFSDDYGETYDLLNEIRGRVSLRNVDWDLDKIDRQTVSRWASSSHSCDTSRHKLVDSLIDELKNRIVKKILAK